MARIRYLKQDFFQDEDLCALSSWHRLCYAGLWTEADRDGRMEDRPKRLKARIFPYDELDMETLLTGLARSGFIVRYLVDGKAYLAIKERAWGKHQRPRNDEPASAIPAPDAHAVIYASLGENEALAVRMRQQPPQEQEVTGGDTGQTPDSVCADTERQQGIGIGMGIGTGNGDRNRNASALTRGASESETGLQRESETRALAQRPPQASPHRDRFEGFWQAYPRKVGKAAAWREWQRLSPDEPLTHTILHAVAEQRASAQWLRDGGQFIPHPRTWLHQGRWEDAVAIDAPAVSRRTLKLAQSDAGFLGGES